LLTPLAVGSSQGRRAWYVSHYWQIKYLVNRFITVAYGLDQSSDTSGPADAMEEVIDPIKRTTVPTSSGLPGWAILPVAPSPSNANKANDYVMHTFSRTNTQVVRDAVFGQPDEQLSDIDDEEHLEITRIRRDSERKAEDFDMGDRRSSTTVVTSPDFKGGITDSDHEMDKPIALKAAGGKASAKKAVIDSETEDDDVEVPKITVPGQDSLRAGRRTRASTALADRLQTVAAAAAKTSVLIDDHTTTTTTKHVKRSGRAALAPKVLENASGNALSKQASPVAAKVALSVSDDFHPHPMAQSVQDAETALSKRSTPHALESTISGLYATDHIPQAIPEKLNAVVKSTGQTGLHLLLF